MPIREFKLKHASVKIHEIVLCVMRRGVFWVTVAHGSLQGCLHKRLQNTVKDVLWDWGWADIKAYLDKWDNGTVFTALQYSTPP